MSRSHPLPLSILLAASILLATTAAAQQQEPAAGFEGLVEVTEVLLDVLATDRSGETVAGLDKDDFLVEENGEPVAVTGVSFYSTRYGADGEPLVAGAVPASRYFIFFFHDQTRSNGRRIGEQLDAARESRRWVDDEMLPSDWVAVASYDYKLKLHLDFSQSRYAITEAISRAARRHDPEKHLGRGGRPLPPLGAPSLLRHLPTGKELRDQTTRIYDGIRLVAEAAGHVVGRKSLMLFTVGFGDFRPVAGTALGDPRYYPPMEEALNDHNVAVYAIDLSGARHGQANFLSQLASDTGGYYYENFVSFLAPLRRISEENTGYYLLSYQSEHPAAEAGFQKVEVKARDREVKVRARKGYRYGVRSADREESG